MKQQDKRRYTEELIAELFPNESYDRVVDLLVKLRRLVPLSDDYKLKYLENLFEYVDGMINGDEITQLATFRYTSDLTRDSLQSLASSVHEQVLSSYREERRQLQAQVGLLEKELSDLAQSNYTLKKEEMDLKSSISELRDLKSSLESDIQKLKSEGYAQVEREIGDRRTELREEVASLNETKQSLSLHIEELKKLLSQYNAQVANLSSKVEVTWEPIKADDSIYNVFINGVDSYISSLEETYQKNTGATAEEAKVALKTNSSGVYSIKDIFGKIHSEDVKYALTVGAAIKNKELFRYNESKYAAQALENIVSNLRLPSYNKKFGTIGTSSLNSSTVPTDTQVLLRELYLQKMSAEALAKQQIAESQLMTLVNAFKQLMPESVNFRELLDSLEIGGLISYKDEESFSKTETDINPDSGFKL